MVNYMLSVQELTDILLLPPTHVKERWSWFCRAKVTKLREKTFSKRIEQSEVLFCARVIWVIILLGDPWPLTETKLSYGCTFVFFTFASVNTEPMRSVVSGQPSNSVASKYEFQSWFFFFLQLAFNGGVLIDRLPLNPLWLKWGRTVQSDVPWPLCWPPVSLEDVLGNCILPVCPICHQLSPCLGSIP